MKDTINVPFDALPPEIERIVLNDAQKPVKVIDDIQDVRKHQILRGVSFVEWSPNSKYIASKDGCEKKIQINHYKKDDTVSLDTWYFAYHLRDETIWSPDSKAIAVSNKFLSSFIMDRSCHSKSNDKIAVFSRSGQKIFEILGDRMIYWLRDGRLLSCDEKNIQIHTADGEQNFTCNFNPKIFLNLWNKNMHLTNNTKNQSSIRMCDNEGQVCAEWKKDEEPPLVDMLYFIQTFYSRKDKSLYQFYVSPENTSIIYDKLENGSLVACSPDGNMSTRSTSGHNIQLRSNKGNIVAEWKGIMACWLPGGKFIFCVNEDKTATIYTRSGDRYANIQFFNENENMTACSWAFDSSLAAWTVRNSNKVQLCTNRGKKCAEYAHGNTVNYVALAPNAEYIASGGSDGIMTIKNLRRVQLANHELSDPTMPRYLLFKKIQDNILKKRQSAILGQTERKTLDEIPDIKKLLRIEINTAPTKLWRISLQK